MSEFEGKAENICSHWVFPRRRERPKVSLRRSAKCVTVRGGQGQAETALYYRLSL